MKPSYFAGNKYSNIEIFALNLTIPKQQNLAAGRPASHASARLHGFPLAPRTFSK
jgi:hypothetical protein